MERAEYELKRKNWSGGGFRGLRVRPKIEKGKKKRPTITNILLPQAQNLKGKEGKYVR